MVFLGGNPSRRRTQLRLHDAPPGYRPPPVRMSRQARQRELREELIVVRVATVAGVLLGLAVVAIIIVMVATH